MTKAGKETDQHTKTEAVADASLAASSARLMSEQAMAMTMMTAVGMSIATQFAGAFMGAFADALEKTGNRKASQPSESKVDVAAPVQATAPVKDKVVPLKVVKKVQPEQADDFKKISGIGPRLAKALNARGIATFADLAALDGDALAKIDAELGLEGRAVRDDWSGQAKTLSGRAG